MLSMSTFRKLSLRTPVSRARTSLTHLADPLGVSKMDLWYQGVPIIAILVTCPGYTFFVNRSRD